LRSGQRMGADPIGGNGGGVPDFLRFHPLPRLLRPAKKGYTAPGHAKPRILVAGKFFQGEDPS
jgi:hypothetical protein